MISIIYLLAVVCLLLPVTGKAGIPVHDASGLAQFVSQLVTVLEKLSSKIAYYKDIISIKDEYIREMQDILYKSESLFWAITYFPKTVPGQFKKNPYFFDLLNKNPWGDLYHKDGEIEDRYPEISDFSYLTGSLLYQLDPKFREYADRVKSLKEQEKKELENEFGLMKMMKTFQEERSRLLDDFEKVIVPAFGSADGEPAKDKVVDVTKLYYAIGLAKLEVLKQNLEMLMMEKELLENQVKAEVTEIRNWMVYETYYRNTER